MWSPLAKLPANSKVAVIGSGVSGLMFTYFLGKLRPDVNITVFDSQRRSGGWINSWHTNDQNGKPIMLERGPRTLRGVSDGTVLIIDTLKDLNEQSVIQCIDKNSEADKKFLLDTNNKLVQVPNSIGSFLKFALNPLSKGLFLGMLGEWRRKPSSQPGKDESVNSFISRRFGSDFVSKNIMSAIFHGIYADDVGQISAKRTLRDLFNTEMKYGSISKGMYEKRSAKDSDNQPKLSDCLTEYQKAFGKSKTELTKLSSELKKYPMLGLTGGMETFPKAVKKSISHFSNVKLVEGEEILKVTHNKADNDMTVDLASGESVTGFNHVRLTISPSNISKLVESDSKKLSQDLDVVKSNTVLLVNYYLPGKDVLMQEYRGFGYLVPQSNKNPQKILGVIFDSIIEKNFKPFTADLKSNSMAKKEEYTKLTVMLGGHYLNYEGANNIPSKEITIRAAKDALNTHLGISQKDLDAGMWAFTVAEKCLPQFFVGYDDWQSMVERQFLKTYSGKVSVGGMGFSKGPGVPDVITDGLQDAIKLA